MKTFNWEEFSISLIETKRKIAIQNGSKSNNPCGLSLLEFEERNAYIKKLYSENKKSVCEIAAEIKLSPKRVYKILKRLGVSKSRNKEIAI